MKRINPHWLKSLAIHAVTLMVATFIGLVVIGNKEAPGMILYSLGAALISPLAYPIVGPYMVAHFLSYVVVLDLLLFWGVVILSYVTYFALLLVAILAKSKYFRIGCCIVLAAWFVLTLFGFSEWVMYWSV